MVKLFKMCLVYLVLMQTQVSSAQPGNFQLPLKEFQHLCETQNNLDACYKAADIYENQRGVPPDADKALALYQMACSAGHGSSCFNLGLAYEYGKNVKKNKLTANEFYKNSFLYYQKKCEKDDADSCSTVGYFYKSKKIIKEDIEKSRFFYLKAIDLYDKSCKNKDVRSCNNLARHYRDGLGTNRDSNRALFLYDSSCEAGYENSCNTLRIAYGYNNSIDRIVAKVDYQKSAYYAEKSKYLHKANCESGDLLECYYLANFLYNNYINHSIKDIEYIVNIHEKACDGGIYNSCNYLKYFYIQGTFLKKDIEKAGVYIKKLCDLGDKKSCGAS